MTDGMVSPLYRDNKAQSMFVESDDVIEFEKKNFEQLSTLRKFYDCLDINGDGMISTEEFQVRAHRITSVCRPPSGPSRPLTHVLLPSPHRRRLFRPR